MVVTGKAWLDDRVLPAALISARIAMVDKVTDRIRNTPIQTEVTMQRRYTIVFDQKGIIIHWYALEGQFRQNRTLKLVATQHMMKSKASESTDTSSV